MIYLIPLLMICLGFYLYDRPYGKKTGDWLWVALYLVLVSIFGLRYKVGADTYNYMNYFMYAPKISDWVPVDGSGFEPGFSILTSLIHTFTDSIYVYQIVISALMTFMLMHFVRRRTHYRFLAMLMIFISMYFYFSTEIIRESLAVCGFLLAYSLLQKKRFLPYYAVCILLLTLHTSAAVCFLMPVFRTLKFNRRFYIYTAVFIFLGFMMVPAMHWLGSNYYVFEKLLRYDKQLHVGYAWCGFRFIYFSLLPFLALYLNKRYFRIPLQYENLICLQIILGIGLWFVPIVFQRLINYTIIFYMVSLANVLGTILRNKYYRRSFPKRVVKIRMQYATLLLALTLLSHSSYYIHLNFYEIFLPYHSILDPVEEPMREKFVQ